MVGCVVVMGCGCWFSIMWILSCGVRGDVFCVLGDCGWDWLGVSCACDACGWWFWGYCGFPEFRFWAWFGLSLGGGCAGTAVLCFL